MSVLVSANRKKWLILASSFLLLVAFGYVEHFTGPEIFFSSFFLIPITLITWSFGFVPGLCFAVLCTLVVTATDAQFDVAGVFDPVIYWNAAMRTTFYLVFCLMMSYIRKELFTEYSRARLDALTGIYNSRAFFERFDPEGLKGEFRPPFTLAYLDLDDFKKVNDLYGHKEGDRLLKIVTHTMERTLRDSDLVARMGGDEFVIAFPDTDANPAQAIIRGLRANLQRAVKDIAFPVTFSIGLVTYHKAPDSVAEVIREADRLMYEVKKKGKNSFKSVVLSGPAVAGRGGRRETDGRS